MELLNVRMRMSTAFQLQTHGQTERMNQVLEAYVCSFCDYDQSNWSELLAYAEFAYNNSVSATTGISPFYANYGYHPRSIWGIEVTAKNLTSRNYVGWIKEVHDHCREALDKARERMGKYYDRRRNEAPPFKVGDWVLLDLRNVKSRCPTKKFDHKFEGPFKVIKAVSRFAFRLELPKRWRIHNVFHILLLEPYRRPTIPGREDPTPEQVVEEVGEVEPEGEVSDDYAPKAIRDIVKLGRSVKYLVEWEGFPDTKDWTLKPYQHVVGCPELVWTYWKEHQDKPIHERFRSWGRKNDPSFMEMG